MQRENNNNNNNSTQNPVMKRNPRISLGHNPLLNFSRPSSAF